MTAVLDDEHFCPTCGQEVVDYDDPEFNEFWETYPKALRRGGVLRREGRKEALARWVKLTPEQHVIAITAARNYGKETEPKFVMRAERFLNKFYMDYADAPEVIAVEQYRPPWTPPNAVPDGQGGWQS